MHQKHGAFLFKSEWPRSESGSQRSFIYFVPSHWQCVSIFVLPVLRRSKDNTITPKCSVYKAHLGGGGEKRSFSYCKCVYLLLTCQRYSRLHVICLLYFLYLSDPLICAIGDAHFNFFCLRYSLTLFIHARLAVQTQSGSFCCECMYMLCQGLVCPRINVFEVNYLERLLAGLSSLCVSKSQY